ncbi:MULTISPECIES: YciI family protein [unclassified Microbacterium]|uniref:YciI family protein n=1 Tax=unclassified Microbacterium TaxID=2609290 RepID=UPI001785B759|nr:MULTISPECIES: YciI family protein [unclassified Microbacterium]MBD8217609.1 YciI family protein [Microbacterium sp. CFBP 13617]MBD8476878.1 YciI family protein [Microbacterium sp. CFBP 8794]
MKFMLIMRGTDEAYAAYKEIPFEQVINEMGAYNESMITAGVLVAGDGLAEDMSANFVVEFGGEEPVVTDGPYGETHELFNGFWIIEVSTRDEAVEWARRAPLIAGNKLEVRRVTDETDFAAFADNEYIQKEEGWREEQSSR